METRVVPGSALALQSRDLCPRRLQLEAQRWSQGWKHRPPVLPPPLRTHPASVLWLQVKTAVLSPPSSCSELCGVVSLTPWATVTQLTSHLLLLNYGPGEPLWGRLQSPT